MKFDKHLEDVNMTYIEHFLFANKVSITLFLLSIILFFHSLFTFLFEHTVSRKIKDLNSILNRDDK